GPGPSARQLCCSHKRTISKRSKKDAPPSIFTVGKALHHDWKILIIGQGDVLLTIFAGYHPANFTLD
ncbi:unnamed protein product, partial [Porites evermanni]